MNEQSSNKKKEVSLQKETTEKKRGIPSHVIPSCFFC